MKQHKLFSILLVLLLPVASQSQSIYNEDPSLDEKIGQMLKIGFRGMQVTDTSHIVRDIKEYHLGGVVLFDYDVPSKKPVRNIESPAQVKKLIDELKKLADVPLLITIDQEGGRVARLKSRHGFSETVSAQYLGTLDQADSTRHYARQTARTLAELGVNVNLAPVVDVNLNPDNPVIGDLERSFSSNPQTVVRHARIFVEAMHDHNILTVLKHFPGHGSSEEDSHKGIVDVTDHWSEKELIPYRQLIDSGHADMIMTAHIFNARWDSTYPATLSRPVISGILRDSLGFSGVVMSDDMMMGAIHKHYGLETAIKQALIAGVDILSFANNSVYDREIVPKAHSIIKKLVDRGVVSREQIDRSFHRIMELKKRIGQ